MGEYKHQAKFCINNLNQYFLEKQWTNLHITKQNEEREPQNLNKPRSHLW